MQRQSSEERPTPSSSSQGDMADTEMEAGRSQQTVMSTPTTVPPKKKRTRTLTTPHQSAVLHALLAQSRFPSTAMREEVGRSIGLSARKVQIWFQNQRQKARRPHSQSARQNVPVSPQDPAPGPSDQGPSTVDLRTAFRNPPYGSQQHRLDERPANSSPTQLLGPGMPGLDYRTSSSFSGHDIPVRSPLPFPSHLPPMVHTRHSQSPVNTQRPIASHVGAPKHRSDVSRTLPPLVFDSSRQPRGCFSAPSAHTSFTRSTGSPRPDPQLAHRLPEPASRQASIPPPFTLQPRWGLASSSFSSLGTGPWSGGGPRPPPGESLSPIRGDERFPLDLDVRRGRHQAPLGPDSETNLPPERSPPLRAGRYDPVRAAIIPFQGMAVATPVSPSLPSRSTREDSVQPDDTRPQGHRRRSRSGSN